MKKQLITLAALAGGFVLGASALVALAQTGGWTPAPGTPPTPNALAPINVGNSTDNPPVLQTRYDPLQIMGNLGILGGNFLYNPSGTTVTQGSVLTAADNLGTVGWSNGGIPSNIAVFDSSGTWTAPAGVTSVRVRAWGGGGNGGGRDGGGGGGGGYGESVLTVAPGTDYTVTVGAGGSYCAGDAGDSSYCNGTNGDNSSFSGPPTVINAGGKNYQHGIEYSCPVGYSPAGFTSQPHTCSSNAFLIAAYGGKGGNNSDSAKNSQGGAGGAASASITINGGNGGSNNNANFNTSGGSSPEGGAGGATSDWPATPQNGQVPGGGGSGSYNDHISGAAGAHGRVIIEY